MNRATAATLAVIISIPGTGPLLAQGAEPYDSPRLERVLKLLQQPEGSVLAPLSSPPDLAATHPDLSRLQAGVLHQQTGSSRRGGNATMIVFYSLFSVVLRLRSTVWRRTRITPERLSEGLP